MRMTSPQNMYGIVSVIVLCVLGVIFYQRDFLFYRHTVTIGDTDVRVRVARTGAQRQLGLGYTPRLCRNCGMLFLFPAPDMHAIWMRRMRVNIDVIWVREGRVVATASHLRWRAGVHDIRVPSVAADVVIEVLAGTVDAAGIAPGDIVRQ